MNQTTNDPKKVIAIQIGMATSFVALEEFDLHEGTHYTGFNTSGYGNPLSPEVEAMIHPGAPQLVITSHAIRRDGNGFVLVDAREVARRVKGINPQAVVLAYTSNRVPYPPGDLDGVIPKRGSHVELPSAVVKAFLDGIAPINLIAMVRSPEILELA